MPNSSPKKLRRTYTRRTGIQKLNDTLEELKSLIQRHCGQTDSAITQVAKTAAEETAARLSPILGNANANVTTAAPQPLSLVSAENMAYQPSSFNMAQPPVTVVKPKKMICPGGPALYNKFIVSVSKNLKEIGVDLPYQSVKDAAGDYWKKVKPSVCFGDESGELLQKFAHEAAMSIAAGQNTSNYNRLVETVRTAYPVPMTKVKSTRKAPKIVNSANAVENFVRRANLPNVTVTKVKKTGKNGTRKVKLQISEGNTPITPGRTLTPQNFSQNQQAQLSPPRTIAPAEAAFAESLRQQNQNGQNQNGQNQNGQNQNGQNQNVRILNGAPVVTPTPLEFQANSQSQNSGPIGIASPLRQENYGAIPLSIAASMPTPVSNANNSVREVNINGKKYFMNMNTKGLYEKDEETNSFGPWVGYRQNNGSIRYTNGPEEF